MDLNTWLKEPGRATAMAKHFGVNKTAVFGWKENGVPIVRMAAVVEYTGGEVTIVDLVRESAAITARREAEKARAV